MLQAFHIEAELFPIPQSTRILTGLGFVLEWGVAVAAKILVKSKKVWHASEKGWTARSGRRGRLGILIETAAEEASKASRSFVHLYATQLSALTAPLKSANGFSIHSELCIGSNYFLFRGVIRRFTGHRPQSLHQKRLCKARGGAAGDWSNSGPRFHSNPFALAASALHPEHSYKL